MSQPPSARPSPSGSPAVRPAPSINLENIYSNLAALIQRVRNNQLPQNQVSPLRSLISTYAKDIIIYHARLGRPNPLLNLPELLNPTTKVGTYEPLTTEAAFLGSIQQGIQAARSIKPDQALIASVAARLRQAQARPPAASPATSARASPQPQPSYMSLAEVKEFIAMTAEERNRRLDADPATRARFVQSYQFYQRRQKATPGAVRPPPPGAPVGPSAGTPSGSPAPLATAATPAVPSTPATPTLPAAPSARPPQAAGPTPPVAPSLPNVPTIPNPHPAPKPASPAPPPATSQPAPVQPSQPTTPATPTLPPQPQPGSQPLHAPPPPPVIPQRPPSPPRPPPPPPEPEPQRRRRKWREYMSELAPGLEVELGIDDLLGEVLDSFIESAARDAVRLAAHRRSARVEAKDVGLVLERQHNITVAGFAQQVPNRVHVPEDSNKRARMVAPRAARRREEE